ncbi:nickel ABC transporter substrate-binding protein [Campylobacter gastrosuis]|uniref:Nickel ABC transporter substrate-binding protein n=1 Tax=Campylobacter gastrosuis TaxID=2974576 RepID=A0ABT7HT47_9BACT|nr:nickel ABC transporter substrate-binding protein [Campylobacter gastrosuis]MDL0089968.1 nickel ABC transporter substrate-binding protein [Campylobacter gastrosuis]
MTRKFLFLFGILCSFMSADTLKFVMSKNVGELNPHLYSPNEMFAQNLVYEALFKYDENGEISPNLAKSYKVSNDGKRYIFTLRDDVFFSDGEKFNASTAKANFDAILANKDRHAWLTLANIITNTQILSEYELALDLKTPYEPTIKELSLIRPFRFISPKSFINGGTKEGIKSPVGTGAYMLVKSELGVSDTFKINPKFWGQKPKIDTLIGKVIPDSNTKIIALKTGEIDLIYLSEQIPLDVLNELKKRFNISISKPKDTLVLALNSNKFPTNDKSVRLALNMLVNKDLLISSVFFDTQKRADFLFSKDLPNCDINATPYEFNTLKAKEILDADGWVLGKDGVRYKNGKPLVVKLSYIGNNAAFKSISQIIQAQADKIGIKIELNADESSIFYKRHISGDFNMIFNSTWGIPYDPEMFLASFKTPSHADFMAQSGLKNKGEIDANITKMLTTFDEKQREILIKNVLKTLHDEAIYLPISFETNIAISSPKLGGVSSKNLAEIIPFEDMYFIK